MKVAYYDDKKFRVITTKGEFIDSSGTITQLTLKNASEDQNYLQQRLDTMRRLSASLNQQHSHFTTIEEDVLNVLQEI